jgi:hypothetical protein
MASTDGFWSSRKCEKNLSPVEKPRKRRRPLGTLPLEPHIMYDHLAREASASRFRGSLWRRGSDGRRQLA